MKLFTLTIFILILFFGALNAEEYRIDLSPEGFKKFSKRGFGKKTIFESGKDDKGYFIKATADSSATGIGLKILEETINSDEDVNLTDNSKGFNNYGAPGADRLQHPLPR